MDNDFCLVMMLFFGLFLNVLMIPFGIDKHCYRKNINKTHKLFCHPISYGSECLKIRTGNLVFAFYISLKNPELCLSLRIIISLLISFSFAALILFCRTDNFPPPFRQDRHPLPVLPCVNLTGSYS